jgi:hypothetical protein
VKFDVMVHDAGQSLATSQCGELLTGFEVKDASKRAMAVQCLPKYVHSRDGRHTGSKPEESEHREPYRVELFESLGDGQRRQRGRARRDPPAREQRVHVPGA